ncbi:hypothetical protein EPI10_028118 [Gossypium australe]|uniref:Uncharacterized protein n=1 Tax=Gossypium australe TaxID=47621 RepID=A0A5B6UXS4_9ROSI|nr:hypothetical protein EPI10_028118 [Gossypium australe]
MAPTPLYWIELSEKKLLGTDFILETKEKVKPDISYCDELVKILARKVKELRNKCIALVKIFLASPWS